MFNVKGTIDYNKDDWSIIKNILDVIRKKVETLNVEEIDTPILENKELLLKKYGDEAENKLIYHLDDCTSLRYDLTVPLVRYVNNNGIANMKRFQIGKVFRKDNPEIEKGRFREFYQADLDIIGDYGKLISEIEIFWLINSVLQELNITNYKIKYNYRENLSHICSKIGITNDKHVKSICCTIDKLDKFKWEQIENELINIKKLTDIQVSQLKELLDSNYLDPELYDFDDKLNNFCQNLTRDTSLARGLDYYTGIIYEVSINNSKTVIAGGRYNKMIYKSLKNNQKKYIPAIGVSFGVSRLHFFSKNKETKIKKIFVVSYNFEIKIKLINMLRSKGYLVNYDNLNRKFIRQITEAVKSNYDFILIFGEDGERIKIKELNNKDKDKVLSYEEIEDFF